jgi:hypothetical protein
VTEAVPWLDAKLYGSSQVVDEGRHVEVFHGYLTRKLEKLYEINDNLYTIVDALMTDPRWDMKFLGMQIMIEGLALGASAPSGRSPASPCCGSLLTNVITDEARHVHFGVLALHECFGSSPTRSSARREDWAFEVSLLLRNRFLAWEFYEEHWAHAFRRSEWERLSVESKLMGAFRQTMFKRIVPNLRRIGLLSERIRSRYDAAGPPGVRERTGRAGADRGRPPRGPLASETPAMASLNALRADAEAWLEDEGRARVKRPGSGAARGGGRSPTPRWSRRRLRARWPLSSPRPACPSTSCPA